MAPMFGWAIWLGGVLVMASGLAGIFSGNLSSLPFAVAGFAFIVAGSIAVVDANA